MNVLKPDLQTTIKTLLGKGRVAGDQRKTGIDRKTIRRYAQVASRKLSDQNPPLSRCGHRLRRAGDAKSPTPATGSGRRPARACSFCMSSTSGVDRGTVEVGPQWYGHLPGPGETVRFHSPLQLRKAVCAAAQNKDPRQYDRLESLMGEEPPGGLWTGCADSS